MIKVGLLAFLLLLLLGSLVSLFGIGIVLFLGFILAVVNLGLTVMMLLLRRKVLSKRELLLVSCCLVLVIYYIGSIDLRLLTEPAAWVRPVLLATGTYFLVPLFASPVTVILLFSALLASFVFGLKKQKTKINYLSLGLSFCFVVLSYTVLGLM